jgi:hypothetical protein
MRRMEQDTSEGSEVVVAVKVVVICAMVPVARQWKQMARRPSAKVMRSAPPKGCALLWLGPREAMAAASLRGFK